ncbi:MAG TPA: adenosylhomocysteinase, partial [Nitrososphaeraceae archaeon]|nr:adenosylhomocysteinase [Nitrososphaeraceae archaeon]
AGEGNASEVMDMSFANQLLSILYIARNNRSLENKLYPVPTEIDDQIAYLALSSFGINIDTLTPSQIKYYNNNFKK